MQTLNLLTASFFSTQRSYDAFQEEKSFKGMGQRRKRTARVFYCSKVGELVIGINNMPFHGALVSYHGTKREIEATNLEAAWRPEHPIARLGH